jgi:predicted transcriptional regulator
MANDHVSRSVLASARQLIDGSREMVASSIARLIATNPMLSPAERQETRAASTPAEILLKLLHSPCDLDVLLFAARHPRALLAVDDIARAVGHDPEDVRVAIETLTVAGLITRTKMRRHADDGGVLFYEFTPGTWDAMLPALCWVAASANGRRALLQALLRRKIGSGPVASELQTP